MGARNGWPAWSTVAGRSRKALGADHVVNVDEDVPLDRIREMTGGNGVNVVLDCTAGAGVAPIQMGVEALKRALRRCWFRVSWLGSRTFPWRS